MRVLKSSDELTLPDWVYDDELETYALLGTKLIVYSNIFVYKEFGKTEQQIRDSISYMNGYEITLVEELFKYVENNRIV